MGAHIAARRDATTLMDSMELDAYGGAVSASVRAMVEEEGCIGRRLLPALAPGFPCTSWASSAAVEGHVSIALAVKATGLGVDPPRARRFATP